MISGETRELASLWINVDENRIPAMQEICLKSYIQLGYKINLYVYQKFENIPDGVTVIDANEIMPMVIGTMYQPCANFADRFRWKLLSLKNNYIWVDLDIYLFDEIPDFDYYLPKFSIGFLYSKDKRIFKELNDYCENPLQHLPWHTPKRFSEIEDCKNKGFTSAKQMHEYGPHAFFGNEIYAMWMLKNFRYPVSSDEPVYPVPYDDWFSVIDGWVPDKTFKDLFPNSFACHLWNGAWAMQFDCDDLSPRKGSLMDRLQHLYNRRIKVQKSLTAPDPKLNKHS